MITRTDDGSVIVYRLDNGYHRPDGPAIEFKVDNTTYWFLFGKRHRYYGPAAIHPIFNSKYWVMHGENVV